MSMRQFPSTSGRISPAGGVCGPTERPGLSVSRSTYATPPHGSSSAQEGPAFVGMASAEPLRGEDGAVIPGGCFLSYLFVVPERWGEGIGGLILDAVLAEARRRHYLRIHLWTHEDNERSHRLYRRRGFSPTGRVAGGEGEGRDRALRWPAQALGHGRHLYARPERRARARLRRAA
jgi:hypothetical protein